jgi:hypothetical protein
MKAIYTMVTALILGLACGLGFSACLTDKKEAVKEFTVSLNSHKIEIGEVEAQFDRILGLGQLKKNNISVSYFPDEDAVCLQYKSDDLLTYYQFWNLEGRAAFLNALEKYNEDYAERNLNRNERKSKEKYGVARGYLIWQLFRYAVQARAGVNVELGYTFKDRSPYFTLYQREAEYIDAMSRDSNRTSQNITLYFTRAQAAELATLFNEQFLLEFVSPNRGGRENARDTYDEYRESAGSPAENDRAANDYAADEY